MFVPEVVEDSCIIVHTMLKYSTEATLKLKLWLVPDIFTQCSAIFFLSNGFSGPALFSKDSNYAFNSNMLSFGCGSIDCTFAPASDS